MAKSNKPKTQKPEWLQMEKGQPPGSLTAKQSIAMIKKHGVGGALVASQFDKYDPKTGKVTPPKSRATKLEKASAAASDIVNQRQDRVAQAERNGASGKRLAELDAQLKQAEAVHSRALDKEQTGRGTRAKSGPVKLSAKKQALAKEYKATLGTEPKARMSMKDMQARIDHRNLITKPRSWSGTQTGAPPAGPSSPPKMEPLEVWHDSPEPSAPVRDTRSAWAKMQTPLAVLGTAVAAKHAYDQARDPNVGNMSRKDAVTEAAKAAAPGAVVLAAPAVAKGAGHVADAALGIAREVLKESGELTDIATSFGVTKFGLGAAAVGGVAKGVELVAKGISRVALPAVVGVNAYQGAKEDTDSPIRGAVRGAIRGLDPTSIFMEKGLGERAFDAVAGSSSSSGPVRLSEAQKANFAKADAVFKTKIGQGQAPEAGHDIDATRRPGWGPEARIAAYQARNPGGANAPYGGDPTQAPGYSMPVTSKKVR